MKVKILMFTLITAGCCNYGFSQDVADTNAKQLSESAVTETAPIPKPETEDTIYPIIEGLQSDIKVGKRLKISGYVQAQYQTADTAGISSISGGNFGSGIDNRIMIRRGRLKFTYDYNFSQAVMQFDITEKGLAIKDAYINVTEPWYQTTSLTGGVFDRPFGYEISYSSSSRETPERSRVFQTLFPGERDLGGKLTLQAPKTSPWNFFKIELGYMNGNGTNVETDKYKDLIGHLSFGKTSTNEKITWGLGGSYYNGGFAATTVNSYKMVTLNGEKGFVPDTITIGNQLKREYIGFDARISLDWVLGMTQIRGEYLYGTQPATASSSSSLTASNVSSSSTANLTTGKVTTTNVGVDAYSRKFQGYYIYFIQNILQTPLQLVVKYDVYDPNTNITGNQIGGTTTPGNMKDTGAADIKYSTLGIGLNYYLNSNVKIMAYYDMVTNETTSNIKISSTLTDLSKDRKDNVFTLRLQYKF